MSLRTTLNGILESWGYVIERSMPAVLKAKAKLDFDFDYLVRREVHRQQGEFCFIQIGANDGQSRPDDLMDYVQDYSAVGLMVEPQPDVFSRLEQNFAEYPGISLINRAVHRDKNNITIYRFDPEILQTRTDLPVWAQTNGIASFDRQHVVDHANRLKLGPGAIQAQSVDCISVDELIDLAPRVPDLLKIDVEGYDFEILDALDPNLFRPRIIRFENLHMPAQKYQVIIHKLSAAGYRFLANRSDTTAYLWSGD